MDVNLVVGTLLVILVSLHRFNYEILRLPIGPAEVLFPPPRAYTTIFKFWLYRVMYALILLSFYLIIVMVPSLANQIDSIIDLIIETIEIGPHMDYLKSLDLGKAGHVVSAFIVVVLLPNVPFFKAGDAAVRRFLYDRACIPSQQLRERNRLKTVPYHVNNQILEVVRTNLELEGFDRCDLEYSQGVPTTQSLWVKAALLIEHIKSWQGKERYKTALAALEEPDRNQRTVDKVIGAYKALKGDAKTCFCAIRTERDKPETIIREAAFRQHCKELLILIYDFLSRVSLHSHFSDDERVKRMSEIGFELQPREGGPIPEPNEIVSLGILLAFVLIIPLGLHKGFGLALTVGCIMYAAVLTPVIIAHRFTQFALGGGKGIPGIAFIMLSGVTAVFLGFCITLIGFSGGDLVAHIQRYRVSGYPWSSLQALIAMLIAWRIRVGICPDTSRLKGMKQYKAWGNLQDAWIFVLFTLPLMALFIMPRTIMLRDGVTPHDLIWWVSVGRVAIFAFAVGFIIPTWYRVNRKRLEKGKISFPTDNGTEAPPKHSDGLPAPKYVA